MRKQLILIAALLLLSSVSLLATGDFDIAISGQGIDWFELIIVTGYLLGVFVLLPWVIYTNTKEKLTVIFAESTSDTLPNSELSEDKRN